MSKYLQHLTWVLIASIPVVLAVTAVVGGSASPPLWGLPVWLAVVLLVSVPVHFAIERTATGALLKRLRADNPAAPAVPVRVGSRDAQRLLAVSAPVTRGGSTARVQFLNGSARAIDRMVVVPTNEAVEFWTGPVTKPTHVASFAWSDVQLPAEGPAHVVVQHEGEIIARLSLTDEQSFTQRVASGDSLRSALAELDRMRP